MGGAQVTVVGAGLGGSLMAIYLARAGHRVRVCERRPDPRGSGVLGGRSINLALSTRGIDALERVGLAETMLAESVPMRGRMIHPVRGRPVFQPYGTEPHHALRSVSRSGLNLTMINAAGEQPGVELVFSRRCVGVDLETATVELKHEETGEVTRVEADCVVGADGAFSAVRARMQRLDRFDYQQSYLDHGFKELTIPALEGGGPALEREALHIWPRGGHMMIALPNLDGSFTCTLFWPFTGRRSFTAQADGDAIVRTFEEVYPDVVALMPDLARDYMANPTSSLVTVRCKPWHRAGRVVLLGDACHAVVPFYGQGANAAFEDCVVLDIAMREHGPDWRSAFATYEAGRQPEADVLANLALANFIEMRDHTASRVFLARKALERGLHRAFPRLFLPLYSMVTFSRMPYSLAVERASRQWRVVVGVAALLFAALAVLVAVLLGVGA